MEDYFCAADLDGYLDRERAFELLDAFCELGSLWGALGIVKLGCHVSPKDFISKQTYHFLILEFWWVP